MPAYKQLVNLTNLQKRVGMIPVGSHTILGQIAVTPDQQRATMRKLHIAIIQSLRTYWIQHCREVAEVLPLDPLPPPVPVQFGALRISNSIAKHMVRARRKSDSWTDKRMNALDPDNSNSDSDSLDQGESDNGQVVDSDSDNDSSVHGESDNWQGAIFLTCSRVSRFLSLNCLPFNLVYSLTILILQLPFLWSSTPFWNLKTAP